MEAGEHKLAKKRKKEDGTMTFIKTLFVKNIFDKQTMESFLKGKAQYRRLPFSK
jgi:hypothetical protein